MMEADDEWDWGVDFFDSREMIARIEYIEGELAVDDEEREEHPFGKGYLDADERAELETELKALKEFADQASGYGDWLHGTTVIADDHFTEYAEQYAKDLGLVADNDSWPNGYVDWDAAADALKQDYTGIYHDGNAWWLR